MQDKVDKFIKLIEQSNHSDQDKNDLFELSSYVFNDNEYFFDSSLYQQQNGQNIGLKFLRIYGYIELNDKRQVYIQCYFNNNVHKPHWYLNLPLGDQYVLNPQYGDQSMKQVLLPSIGNNFSDILNNIKIQFQKEFPYVVNQNYNKQVISDTRETIKYIAYEIKKDIDKQKEYQQNLIDQYIMIKNASQNYLQAQNYIRVLQDNIENNILLLEETSLNLEGHKVTEDNVDTYLQFNTENEQIIDLKLQLQSNKEVYKFIQAKFLYGTQKISYEWMVQQTKRLADKEFDSFLLLQKCIKKNI